MERNVLDNKVEDQNRREFLRGFTLIELLVVIAIIALLMGILMPALQRVKKSSQTVVCQAHLKSWSKAFLMYTGDYENKFPSTMGGSGGLYGQWTIALKPYYGNELKIWFCPVASKPTTVGGTQPFAAWVVTENQTNDLRPGDYGSYGINAWVYDRGDSSANFNPDHAWKNTFVETASNIPVFGDCMWRGGFPEDDDTPQTDQYVTLINDNESMRYFNMNRHNGTMNMVFMDFSVSKVPLKQLWRLKWNKNFDITKPPPEWPDWMQNLSGG
jgi:prepilin-type N-terminal cleavage/methylation domain-containing protein/prepilin-type processing-associated H-X9-DG protein